MAKFYVLSTLLILAARAFALPSLESRQEVLHCGNGTDVCPSGWTCCGPLIEGIGGTCRKLKPEEVCIF